MFIVKRVLFWIALLALVVLHHDWWFWDDGRLIFGFLPVGLAYHAVISLAAGGLWAWAILHALSDLLEDEGEEPAETSTA
jgi:hypothetical protein